MTQISEACCDKGTTWGGTPSGKEEKLGGLDVYVARPKATTKAAVLYITDVHTWEAKNARLLADKLASNGFLTVIPDFFHRDYPDMSDRSKFPEWRARHPDNKVVADAEAVIAALKTEHSISKIGATGYCWGGKYTTLLAGKGEIDANVVSHGSLLVKEDITAIQKPTLFLFSDNDFMIPTDMRLWIEETLVKKKEGGLATDSHFYPGQAHGWTQRGDDKDPEVAAAAADAFQRTLAFFKQELL